MDDNYVGADPMTADSSSGRDVVIKGDRDYEIATAHGTRIILSRRRGRWMRLPAQHEDGTVNRSSSDGEWQALRGMYSLGVDQADELDSRNRPRVWIGHSLRLHTDFRHWWDTTEVVSVRELAEDEVPAPA